MEELKLKEEEIKEGFAMVAGEKGYATKEDLMEALPELEKKFGKVEVWNCSMSETNLLIFNLTSFCKLAVKKVKLKLKKQFSEIQIGDLQLTVKFF